MQMSAVADPVCTKSPARAGSHEELLDQGAISTTTLARNRVFSLGLNSLELRQRVCQGPCSTNGTGYLSLSIRCQASDVRMTVLASATELAIREDEPSHGEVCPNLWTYHKLEMSNTSRTRITVHVHQARVHCSPNSYTPYRLCGLLEAARCRQSSRQAALTSPPPRVSTIGSNLLR